MDLKKIFDPKAKFIFFKHAQLSYAFQIVHVENDLLYFVSDRPLPQTLDQGYVPADEQTGIILFDAPVIDTLHKKIDTGTELYLHRINFAKLSYTLTNRRQSPRLEIKEFLPVSFNVFGESVNARILNISEGGIKMQTDTALKQDTCCQLHITIPQTTDPICFITNAVVVHTYQDEDSAKPTVGLAFAAPKFKSEQEQNNYIEQKQRLVDYINSKV